MIESSGERDDVRRDEKFVFLVPRAAGEFLRPYPLKRAEIQ